MGRGWSRTLRQGGGGPCCHLLSGDGGDTGPQRVSPSLILCHTLMHTHPTPARLCRPRVSPWAGLRVADDTHAHVHAHACTRTHRTDAFPWPAGRRAISEAATLKPSVLPEELRQTGRTPSPQRRLGDGSYFPSWRTACEGNHRKKIWSVTLPHAYTHAHTHTQSFLRKLCLSHFLPRNPRLTHIPQ